MGGKKTNKKSNVLRPFAFYVNTKTEVKTEYILSSFCAISVEYNLKMTAEMTIKAIRPVSTVSR